MKLTKFTHACFTLEHNNQTLIFDPGNWSDDLVIPDNVAAVVLTHKHADHFDPALLHTIMEVSPSAVVILPESMATEVSGLPLKSVTVGDTLSIGPFHLGFYGGTHAVIHPSIESVMNLGVLVNDSFYYPGDSFARPDRQITTLALPVVAPWLKISESIDFLLQLQPKFAFPVHDHIASDEGKKLVDRIISGFAKQYGGTYQRLESPKEV